MSAPVLTLVSRRDCPLCDEMLEALREFGARVSLPPLRQIDVDSDPQLQRLYGLQVPVLLVDDVPVCRFRLDEQALERRLAGA